MYTYCHTRSLPDARPISGRVTVFGEVVLAQDGVALFGIAGRYLLVGLLSFAFLADLGDPVLEPAGACDGDQRSEEHTSELHPNARLVCRLLLDKREQRRRIILQNPNELPQLTLNS